MTFGCCQHSHNAMLQQYPQHSAGTQRQRQRPVETLASISASNCLVPDNTYSLCLNCTSLRAALATFVSQIAQEGLLARLRDAA
jgi:hypothetical protein